jgi:endonuclease III
MEDVEADRAFTIKKEWLDQFGNIILHYNEKRISDPFMAWFREQNRKGGFANNFERILMILIDARFDQQTTAEKAFENTKRVFKAGVLKKQLERNEIPLLIPRQMMTAEKWTDLFYEAIPRMYKLATRIEGQKEWSAEQLLSLMHSPSYKVPYLGTKTSRLAVRWLYELIPDLKVVMSDYKIPIDVLVYRVACRLGLIDPYLDKYYGEGSPADLEIQSLAKALFPDDPWFLDEPLWSSGRQPSEGGHCFPTFPDHQGCILEEICPKRYVDFDPSKIGMEPGADIKHEKAISYTRKAKVADITDKQKRFNEFVQQLKKQGITGEEYRRKISEWFRTNP